MPDTSDWKRHLLTLKDAPFFELVQTYLGKVQTPYHKPSLIDTLERFLTREETQARIFALMEEQELQIVRFVSQSDGIGFDELYPYFRDDFTRLRFRSLIENLEDRLILYRDDEKRYRLNPIFLNRLESVGRARPLPSAELAEAPEQGWLSVDLFLAFLALIKELPALHKQDGELKKTGRIALDERLPGLTEGGRARLLLDIAEVLELSSDNGGETVIAGDALASFLEIGPRKRYRALLGAAAAGAFRERSDREAYRLGLTILETLEINLDPAYSYPLQELSDALTAELSAAGEPVHPQRVRIALDRLAEAGFLYALDDSVALTKPAELFTEESRPLILQPTFEILIGPDTLTEAKLFAARYCRLERYDRFAKYELEHDLFLRHVKNQGLYDELDAILERLVGGKPPQNVLVTVRGWMDESRQIEISTGTVIKVAEELVTVIEEHFANLLLETLAPGVYFVRPEKLSPFLTRWRSLGYADPGEIRNHLSGSGRARGIPLTPEISPPKLDVGGNGDENESGSTADAEAIREELSNSLAQMGGKDVSDEQRRELNAKIEKKLFLYPDQIRPETCRIGRIEARGIDFHAKLRIIEDVLENRQDLLELVSPETGGEARLVHPLELNKEPGNPCLKALVLPEEREANFRVRLVSRIRKRKRSLFY